MKYKIGDKVTLTDGNIMTIDQIDDISKWYRMKEDPWNCYTNEMIEGLVEEECPQDFIEKYCKSCGTQRCDRTKEYLNGCPYYNTYVCEKQNNNMEYETLIERVDDSGLPFNEWLSHKGAFHVPEDYVLKDENGNVINATKIVLEKKKKEYPKTYEECYKIMGVKLSDCYIQGYKSPLLEDLQELLICRNAYWKLYGEEMGLGKPWEPDWGNPDHDSYPTITRCGGKIIRTTIYTHDCPFSFPTEEMRDAFYENFKKEIENCKELL